MMNKYHIPKSFAKGLKDTHREKAPSNKTPALRKSTNMGAWAVVTLNLFEVLKLKQNFQ